jgi:rhamnose utilization protein RhaD (predicted bifunctional aldolase and dehydrogenase)/NAD(P)-dependent dehydrogenase (short-subunit alcohol dehydrogenase family)
MQSRWSDAEARAAVERWGPRHGEALALRVYTSRLLGADPALVLHGGGNTSLKDEHENALGEKVPALYVKASGHDLATIVPEGLPATDLARLRRLRAVETLSDEAMVNELRGALFDARAATPSIETLMHAWLAAPVVDHTHADAILALSNRPDGAACLRDALGDDVIVLSYVRPGFDLARVAADAADARPGARAMVLLHHGVFTWGGSARESYERMIAVVDDAERWTERRQTRPLRVLGTPTPVGVARARAAALAPRLRGALATASGDADRPWRRCVVRPLLERAVLDFVDAEGARAVALSPPLTPDHLIRTKALPLWLEAAAAEDGEALRAALAAYARDYEAYVERHRALLPPAVRPADPMPRIVLVPGVGALCAGPDAKAADVVRDITRQTLAVKARIAGTGADYAGLSEGDLFEMEYYALEQAKLGRARPALGSEVALVTGAAGAIGAGVVRGLLGAGAHVVATDLPGPRLDALAAELAPEAGPRLAAVPLDVTDPDSVSAGFAEAALAFGGIDLVVVNAGAAHAAPLAELSLDAFRRLERVNAEGTLLLLREAARHFAVQGTGGDVVLVSTKNVFAPGAGFGAYSATKAAAHQLARIASLELAPLGVRVNMVAPDAVFGDAERPSGLWQEVGPERMRARGLDAAGLEAWYRERNLLRARVTPEHVARAVLFFATRQTPTTGATLPVDGGLPEGTPR